MRIKKFLIFFLLGLFLATPLIGLAQFQQQQTYPGVGGQNLVGSSASKSIPTLVKYLFNLAVWICILVAVLVLIAGGIQYVASTGDVSKMTGAKTRIYSSLLGLTILIGAWFVLHTMNPSLVIPKITYVPIKQGIVFFTKDGHDDFMKPTSDASIINDLVNANQAKFINYSSPDLTLPTAFGPLIFSGCFGDNEIKGVKGSFPSITIKQPLNGELNFADFQPYTFAFWGKKAQGAKLTFYNQPQYVQVSEGTTELKPQVYDYRGLLDENGNTINTNGSCVEDNDKIKDAIIIKPACFDSGSIYSSYKYKFFTQTSTQYLNAAKFFSQTDGDVNKPFNDDGTPKIVKFGQCKEDGGTYFNLIADQGFRNSAVAPSPMAINHPPLSVRITWSNAGVYLVDANNDERYFDASAKDFKDPSINFDQKAQDIKIINDIPARTYVDEDGISHTTPAEPHDFLAILHQEDNFSGNLKIYFEARKYNTELPASNSKKAKNKFIPAFTTDGTAATDDNLANPDVDKPKLFKDNGFGFYYIKAYTSGHLPTFPVPPDNKSITTEEVKNQGSHDGGPLNEYVYGRIITSVSSLGIYELADNQTDCQEVRLCTEKQGRGYCIAYVAKDSAKKEELNAIFYPMPVYVPVNIPCPQALSCVKPIVKTSEGDKEVNFGKNIKSIIIKPEGKCAVVLYQNWITLDNNPAQLWSGSMSVGPRSEVFTTSDYNLDDNEIGMCGSFARFGGWASQPCASAIAVYPIK